MGEISKKKYPLWSIWYEDEGYDINGQRIMGRQAAGWSFLKGIIKDKPDRISAYIKNDEQRKFFIEKVKSEKPEIIDSIKTSGKLEENTEKLLTQLIVEYKKITNNA